MYNRRLNPELGSLYEEPDLSKIEALYKRLITSADYRDREVGLWLGLIVETPHRSLDFRDLQKELEEMEYILTSLMSRVDESSQRELNDWVNYLTNAAYGIRDGFWFDAKIDMNRALKSSNSEALNGLKNNLLLGYEIALLQSETSKIFDQLKNLPVSLNIREDRLDLVLNVEAILLEVMKEIYLRDTSIPSEVLKYVSDHTSSALRYSMKPDTSIEQIRNEMEIVSHYLVSRSEEVSEDAITCWIREMQARISMVQEKIRK